MKKTILFTLILFGISISLSAQYQKGYVKTKGRMLSNGSVQKGTRLSGVQISSINGNATISRQDGTFSLSVPSTKFYLKSVKKNGFVLSDGDILTKQYTLSSNPLILVLEDDNQKIEDQLMVERRLRRSLQVQLKEKEEELFRLREDNKLGAKELQMSLNKLYKEQKNNELIIEDIVNKYSQIDFDNISEIDKKIHQFIVDGNFYSADSLLKTKGDIWERKDKLLLLLKENKILSNEIITKKAKLDKRETLVRQEQKKLMEDCVLQHTIHKLKHENDSASLYIRLRADLDSANIGNQLDAAFFLSEYASCYDDALLYTNRAISYASQANDSISLSMCYAHYASTLKKTGKYDDAISEYIKALDYISGNNTMLSNIYNNIGKIYHTQGLYEKALDYYQKSLALKEDNVGRAETLNNIGEFYLYQRNDCSTALEYYFKTDSLFQVANMTDSIYFAKNYESIASAFTKKGEYEKSKIFYEKAFSIYLKEYGELHPSIAKAYAEIGLMYERGKKYQTAIDYQERSLNIYKKVFGEYHPEVAMDILSLGLAYNSINNYEQAMSNYYKALEIFNILYGDSHAYIATTYSSIGKCYYDQRLYTEAETAFMKALSVFKNSLGDRHPYVATVLFSLGETNYCLKKYNEALTVYMESLSIFKEKLGENNPKYMKVKENIEKCKEAMK